MKDSESKLRAILDNTTDNIVLMDTSFKVLCFNETIKKTLTLYFGKELKEGDDYRDFVIPPVMSLFLESFDKAIKGETVLVENKTKTDDVSIWFQYKVNPVYDKSLTLIGVALTAKNIDEQKRAEIALRQSEEKFRKIIESATNPIIIIDKNLKIKMVNPEVKNIFGYNTKELLDKDIELIIPEGFNKQETNKLKNGQSLKIGREGHTQALKKNGEEIIIEACITTFRIDAEDFILVMIQDVTQRILSEHKLKKANLELLLLNKINDIILLSKNENTLLEEICRTIVEKGGYKLAWVCEKPNTNDKTQIVKPMAAFGKTDYVKNLEISLTDNVLSKGPTATALRFGKTVITNNVSKSDDFKPWLENAQKHGIRSSLVLPLNFNNKINGCLNIYSENINAFDENEVVILERLADNVSLAINTIRIRNENDSARYQLNERVKELKTIYLITAELQDENQSDESVLSSIVNLIPKGWQFPEICSTRIFFDGDEYPSLNYKPSSINQTANFKTVDGKKGVIEVLYDSENLQVSGEPFLREERDLINTLAEMLMIYFNKKALLQELKKSEANLYSVFENTEVGHLLLDKDLNVVSFNHTFFNGYARSTGINFKKGVNFNSMLIDEKKEFVESIYNNVKENKKHVVYDTSYSYNNITYHYNISISPILEGNEISGYCISALDITKRKMQELEKQIIITDLTQRNRDLEQFSYIVSHNIRAPLSSILGLADILDRSIDEKDRQFALAGITKSAKNLDSVIKDLNDILKTRREISEIKVDVSFTELVKNIQESLRYLINESEAIINYNFDEADSISTIKSYMQNVFYNLISNSIKYAREGIPPRIDIWTEKKNDKIILNFSDNGIGIDLERHGHQLFGLYKRFNLSVEGKGIGLYMVKTQVEALNGSIKVISTLNKGTHFAITLATN